MLKIVKASEPIKVESLNVCIYGAPGTGKTTAAFSAQSPLLLDFDKGAYRAGNRKDIVSIDAWNYIESLTQVDLKGYSTIVIDTAGRALDMLTQHVIKNNPNYGRGGSLNQKGWGELKTKFRDWMKTLNQMNKDVIIIAHMDEKMDGDDVMERLDVQGGSKNEIYKSMDAMARIAITPQGRILDFNPHPKSYGKNLGQLDLIVVPNITIAPDFMAGVIAQIKSKLNEQTEEQRQALAEIAEWQENVKGLKTADDFNDAVAQVKDASKAVRLIVSKAATDTGMVFDKEQKKYIDATQTEAVPGVA